MPSSCGRGNSPVTSLIRSYGRGLTAVFIALTVAWILVLILLPQLRLIERAFTFEDRGGAAAQLAIQIDRLYTEAFTLDTRIADLKRQAEASQTGAAPSPGAPSPAAPSASIPSPGLPSPGMPSPSLGGGVQQSPQDIAAAITDLEGQKADLDGRIKALEADEAANNQKVGSDASYSLKNFTSMSRIHFEIFLFSILYALCVTVLAFLVCYPVAYAVATAKSQNTVALLMLALVVPYAINELLRIFAWVMILEKRGILNGALDGLGIIDMSMGEGLRFVASNGAVFTVMVYTYVLFMVFPIYNAIETLDKNQIEAAKDLGASTWRIHWRVVLPHAKPGIAVGAIMTFMLSAGSIAVPEVVGRGLHPDWFSQVIYRRFFEADSWNQGAAYSLALLVACIVFILVNMSVFRVGIRDIAK